jgi:hypothetical protein
MFKRRAFFSLPILGFLPAFLRGDEPPAAENPKKLPVLTEVTNVDELMGDTPWTESPPEYRMKGQTCGYGEPDSFVDYYIPDEEYRSIRVWMPPTFRVRCKNDYYGEVELVQLRTVDPSRNQIHNNGSHIRETADSTPRGPRVVKLIDNKPEFEPYDDIS